MHKVLEYMKRYAGMLAVAIALLFLQAMTDLALPDYMSDMVNTGVMGGDTGYILRTGGKMLAVALLGAAASVTVGYLAAMVAANVARDMRLDVFKRVQAFSNAEFDQFSTASLITRTTNDITQVQNLLVMAIRLLVYAPILGVGGIIRALDESTSMTWVIAVAVIVLVGTILLLFSIALPKFRIVQQLIDRLNLVTRENLDGMLVIRAFNTQSFEEKRFDKANRDLTDVNLFVNRAMSTLMPIMMLVMNLTTVLIVWVGARQVSSFDMEIGTMMGFMQYAMQIIMSFLMLSMMFIMIPRAAVSANRVADVLETGESVLDPTAPQAFPETFVPTVEFRNVNFRYPSSDGDVLHDISFTAEAGKTTALIGATGSGKTTIASLMLRFYDVTEGQVLIGGRDVRDVTKRDLRDRIAYVPQKSVLFTGSIRSNLAYSDRNASAERVERAASIAQATEFIASKDEGYEAPIAQGGTNVSGGQKQRLSIGRALVKNAPINIFDDSFSALDLKTDRRLRETLKREVKDQTMIIVAQRVSTIKDADRIIVLDNGGIAGIGTHRELLANCETYLQIARSQLSEAELAK